MKIKDLQKEEKPREKMFEKGCEALTDVELLAIILRSGGRDTSVIELSRSMFNRFNDLKGILSSDICELVKIKHVDYAKAASIKAVEEISKRFLKPNFNQKISIKSPKDAFEIIRKEILNKEQEYLFLISLDCRNNLISINTISKGTVNETLIHPREIFKCALEKNACSIILVHNHPSNNASPSEDDIKVTKRILKAGEDIGIPLADHIVVTNTDFISMRANKLIGG